MKIALVHRRYSTNGGTERYLVGLVRWLLENGHTPVVLANEVCDDQREPGVRFVHLPVRRPTPFLKLPSLWMSARRALGAESWDAVMGFGRTGGHHLFRAGGGSHVTALRREHPLRRWVSPVDWLEIALDRRAVRGARICLANSKLGARGLLEDYAPRRVEVVYNGVDLGRFRPDLDNRASVRAHYNVQGPMAVFVGNGFHRKGLREAIEAMPSGWTLVVVGADAPWPGLPNVRFAGSQREPERVLQAADVLVLPTKYDPFANVCLEALACGVPVITTSWNGASEILPERWMVADDGAALRAAWQRVDQGGIDSDLGAMCRLVAERYTPDQSYGRAFALLVEAAQEPE